MAFHFFFTTYLWQQKFCLRLNLQVQNTRNSHDLQLFPSWCSGTAEEHLWRLWIHCWLWQTQLRPQLWQRNLKWWNSRLHPQDVWEIEASGFTYPNEQRAWTTSDFGPVHSEGVSRWREIGSRRTKIPEFTRRKHRATFSKRYCYIILIN